jgi:hypothetical protein
MPAISHEARMGAYNMAPMNPVGSRSGILAMSLAAAACVLLMGFNGLTRVREFTPDSMSYVDVARNFAAGRGLSQSALGFGRATFTPEDPIPSPFTAHAPGFSILIAIVGRAGVPFEDAALLLAALFSAMSIAAAFLFARECYGVAAAWLTVAVLINYYPLRHGAAVAWSETTAICAALSALWLLARYRRGYGGVSIPFAIGLLSGVAFAFRYPMSVLAVVTGAGVITTPRGSRVRAAAACAIGVASSAGPVLLRNIVLTHTLTGAASNPYQTPLVKNVVTMVTSLSEIYQPYYLETPAPRPELWALIAVLVFVIAALGVQRRLRSAFFDSVLDPAGPLWLTLFAVAYLAFITVARSLTWFDDLTHRLTLPAGVAFAILVTAFVAAAVRRPTIIFTGAALLLAAALAREMRFVSSHAAVARGTPWTPRLTWVASHTTPRDLIIGDYTMDLPFYFVRRNAITFEQYPYTFRPTYESLKAYVARHCTEYDHEYLVVRNWYGTNVTAWVQAFGWMISDLMVGGDNPKYPEYHLLTRLDDSAVFNIAAPACGR